MHETGHLTAALLTRSPVVEAELFPAAYVTVDVSRSSAWQLTALTLSGLCFPLLFLLVPDFHSYWLAFAKLTVSLMTGTGALTSLAAVLGYPVIGTDDAALLLRYFPEQRTTAVIVLVVSLVIAGLYIVFSKPIAATVAFLSGKMEHPTLSEA
ncbi:hypothetical protein [Ruminococcus sp.]|uniref:hypothetical protein n=1 Tax=Ruminococcus sp. TaxID=41978 RepID=UPI00388F7366